MIQDTTIPKAFISYSHDSQEHKKWVLELAKRLRNNGIDAILDQFELQAGDDIPHFMETHLADANKILMVCSERYVEKANKGQGGVGYEKMIVTSNLMKQIDENKIIPIIRQKGGMDAPTFLKSKLYINFSKDDNYESNYDDLVRTIHNAPLFQKPPVGNNPFTPVVKEELDGDIKLLHSVLRVMIETQGDRFFVDLSATANKLNISFALCKVMIIKLVQLGYARWYLKDSSIHVLDKGLLYAYENKLLS